MSPFWDSSDAPRSRSPWASLGGRGSDDPNSFISWFLGGGGDDDSEDTGRGQEGRGQGGRDDEDVRNKGSGEREEVDDGAGQERNRNGGESSAGGRINNDYDEGHDVPETGSRRGEESSGGGRGGRVDESSNEVRWGSIGDQGDEGDGRDNPSAGSRDQGRPSSDGDDDVDQIRAKERPGSSSQPEDMPAPPQPSGQPSAKTVPTVSSPDDGTPASRPSSMSVSDTTDDDDAESEDTSNFEYPVAPVSSSTPSGRTNSIETTPTDPILSATPTVSYTPTPSSSDLSSANNNTADSSARSDSGPEIAGIVVGVVFGVLTILALVFFFRYRHVKRKNSYSSRRSLLLQSAGLRRPNSGAILLQEDSPAPSPGLIPDSQFQQSYYRDESSMAQYPQGDMSSYPQGMVQVPPQARTPSIRSIATTDSGPSVAGLNGAISMFPMPPSAGEIGRPRGGTESPGGYGYRGYGTHPAYQPDWTPVRPRARDGSV